MARPKAFDETQALDAAMTCFWDRGYEATSIRDLTDRMGIAGPSLYNTFGDKRALFERSLEHYCTRLTYERIARIEAETPPVLRIGRFLGDIVDRSVDDETRRGCFLINSAIEVAPHDPAMGAVIAGHLTEVRNFFARSLAAARAADRLSTAITNAEVERAADHLMAVLLGIRVLARTRPERDLLEGIVAAALTAVGLPAAARH